MIATDPEKLKRVKLIPDVMYYTPRKKGKGIELDL
jgi:hypothetical protein